MGLANTVKHEGSDLRKHGQKLALFENRLISEELVRATSHGSPAIPSRLPQQ